MKILLVSPYGGVPGGITRWTEHIIEYYKKYGTQECDLDLVPMGRDRFVNINSNVCYRIWTAIKDYRKILKTYCHKLREDNYDVVHLTSSASLSLFKDLFIIHKAKQKGIKTILHFHFGRIPILAQLRNWEWKLLTKIVKYADAVVVIDKASFDTLIANGFNNVKLLPNPIAPSVLKIAKENRNIKRIEKSILFVGHVVKTKGIFELLEATSHIPGVTLKMIGHITPQIRSEIETLYNANAMWLDLAGEQPYTEVIKNMCCCDIFVLPTYTEGFPNVILESMACGCAIITTPVGAIPEILEEQNGRLYGIMVEPQNVDQLQNAIEKMLSDTQLKDECRVNVQHRVSNRYNIDSIWRQLVGIWEETVV